ncbi:MAG: DUF2752 domain-containing protein [Acidimicrobiales bacterium]|nr:DUF2752 domain-containing protein [Acidimicrobiales bacterium]
MYVTPDPDASAPLATPSVAGEPGPRRWYQRVPAWAGPVAVGAIAASACAYTAIVDPNTNAGIFPACYFKEITGLDCPGCGLTRAAHALLLGDPLRALNHNVLSLIVFPVLLYAYIAWFAGTLGWKLPQLKMTPRMGWVAAGLVIGFWVVRNLPGPLSFLDAVA